MKELYIVTKRVDNNYKKVIIIDGTTEKIKELFPNQNIKVDHVTEMVEVTKEQLIKLIIENEKYKFPYGLVIDGNYILCEELTLYSIIDYENKQLNITNLKKYFQDRNIKSKIHINNISVINTESILLEENHIPLKYYNGFHIKTRLNKNELINVIKNSSTKLLNLRYPSGKFIYCLNALTGEKHTTYNILRHAGSIWALISAKSYINEPTLKEKIDKSIEYLLKDYVLERGNKAFLFKNEKKTGFSVGSTALILLVLAEYQLHFHDDKYLEIAKKFANGIISMQQPNGQYYQIYNEKLELESQFECEYYDGETTLSLIKIYNITKDKKYLDSVLDALDYYIDIGFEKYSDHWIAYTLAELSEFIQNEKIISFAARNVSASQRTRFNPTRLESNVQLYRFYTNIKKYPQFSDLIEEFPIEQVKSNVKFYLETLMSYYIGEETAIYMKNIEKSQYGFFCPTDNNRMRIDDIQHSLMGIINYCHYYNDNK